MIIRDGDTYNAVVSFVAEDLSHGYVVLVEGHKDLHKKYIYEKHHPSFKFHPAKGTEPEKWQIVEVKITYKKKIKLASITRNTYVGLKDDNEVVIPVGEFLRSRNFLEVRKPEPEFLSLQNDAPVDYFLYYDEVRRQLVAKEPAPVENEQSFYNELKLDFTYHTNQVTSKGIVKAGEIAPLLLQGEREKILVHFQVKFLISKLEEQQNDVLSKLFVKTFSNLVPEVLDSKAFSRIMGGGGLKLVRLWLQEDLPVKLLDPLALQKWHSEHGLFKKLELEEFCSLFYRIRNFPNYTYLLEAGLNALQDIPEKYLKKLTQLVNFSINQDELREILFQRLSFDSLLSLWRAGDVKEIPARLWKENFEIVEEGDKIRLLKQINWETFIDYSGNNWEPCQEIIEKFLDYFEVLIGEKINYFSFDLEVSPNTGKINELAYKTRSEEDELFDPEPEEVLELKKLIENADLIVGHNIKRFDLQKLYGEDIPELKIWDTLQVETLLNPQADSFALKTAHEALKDVEHCLKLFRYQVYRLVTSKELRHLLQEANIVAWIPATDLPFLKIQEEDLEEIHKEIFHTSGSKINKLFKGLIPYKASLLVCPESLWGHFRDEPKIAFAEVHHPYQLVLDRAKMEEKLKDHLFLRCCLESYIKQCVKNEVHPYVRRISAYLVYEIEKLFPIEQISFQPEINQDLTITSEWYFMQKREEFLKTRKTGEVYLFGTDLWKYLSKRKFAALHREDLFKANDENSLWVKFSNGRSHTEVDKDYAKELEPKIMGSHFWIEKQSADQFALWGGNATTPKGYEEIRLEEQLKDKKPKEYSPVRYVTFTQSTRSRITDLNPETLYRNVYWEAKLKTLVYLLNKRDINSHCVLLISNKDEVEDITSILKKAGRYSPAVKAPLRRRLELLSESDKGILVAPVESLDQLLSFPQAEGIAYVMESLCPEELLVISGTRRENKVQDVKNSVDDEESETEGTELPHFSSIGTSIKKLSNYYNWLYSKILLQNKDNELVIFDPRATRKLFSAFTSKPLAVDFKKIQESQDMVYRLISEQVQSLIYSPREFEYDDMKEHLDRIAAIFLKGKGGEFKAAQHDFLEHIFPGKEDVLVTLPTGVGKSVLFQGPSLYRSSYTGRLSIVVTPLKALMEDHVMGLWKLGFWNAVDFINSDKGTEVRDIYRKIAGGELLMVFVTPERFRSRGFIKAMEDRMKIDGRLEYLIFDEAHCISQWGSEFRPDYFYCSQRVREIRRDRNFPLLLLSATVTRQVAENIENALYEKV